MRGVGRQSRVSAGGEVYFPGWQGNTQLPDGERAVPGPWELGRKGAEVSGDDDSLFDAYRRTRFWVNGPEGRFFLRHGSPSPQLDRLLASAGVTAWAYVTACNPGSIPLTAGENDERMQRLEADVVAAAYAFWPGEGVGAVGDWPPEPSLLILGIEEEAARELGRVHGQKAILAGCAGEPARILPC